MEAASVGVVGLGSMGMGSALALVDAGFQVYGFDIDEAKLTVFEKGGGIPCRTPAEAARNVKRVVTLVVNAAQVESVLFGQDGLAEELAGGVLIQSATTSPDWIRALEKRLAVVDIRLVDAPVSGGHVKAREGNLSIMASAPPDVMERVSDVFDGMAENLFIIGDEVGLGSAMKLVNQLLAGVHIATAAESIAFAIRMGLDPKRVLDVISQCAGTSWMFENRVPHIVEGDYSPRSAVSIFVKDLGLVLDTARASTFPLPLSANAFQLFSMASSAGFGAEDDSAVVKIYEALSTIRLPKSKL